MVDHAGSVVVARRVVSVLERRDVRHDEVRALLLGLVDPLVSGDAERPSGVVDRDQAVPLLDAERDGRRDRESFRLELWESGGSSARQLSQPRHVLEAGGGLTSVGCIDVDVSDDPERVARTQALRAKEVSANPEQLDDQPSRPKASTHSYERGGDAPVRHDTVWSILLVEISDLLDQRASRL